MLKKAKLILIATLLLSGCSAMESESKRHKSRNKICARRNGSFKICRSRFPTTCRKDAIEFAKKHRKEFEKVGEQFLWTTSV